MAKTRTRPSGEAHTPDEWEKILKLNRLEAKHHLPKGLLREIIDVESNGNPHGKSWCGAKGLFQLMPAFADDYNVSPMQHFASANAAAKYFESALERYHGDLAKALAGYNWGPGNLAKCVRKHGARWLEHAPKETRDYVAEVKEGIEIGKARDEAKGVRDEAKISDIIADHAPIVKAVQKKLAELGYGPGKVTGEFNTRTEHALAQFEQVMEKRGVKASKSREFEADGLLDFASISMLLDRDLETQCKSLRAPKAPHHAHGKHSKHHR